MKTILALGAALALAPSFASAWWDDAWTARRTVTLDTSATGVPLSSALTSVPVAIRLHSGNFDFASAREDGADLRFVAADDKTVLKHHIERYDSLNELAVVWVQVPALAPGKADNTLYVYAGNAAASAPADAGPGYDGSTLAVWHFSDPTPLVDVVSGATASGNITHQKAALLGDAAIFAGSPVTVSEVPALAMPAGGAWTVSMWVKPAAPQQATLYGQGSFAVRVEDGIYALNVGAVRVTGGALKPGVWQHVAATVGGGKATLHVDGQAVGSADAALEAAPGNLRLGEGYAGELDEVQVASTARSAEWIKLAALGESADSNFVAVRADDEAEGGEGGHNYFGILIENLTVDAWVVIVILGVMFVISAWVMVVKAMLVGRIDGDNRRFLQRFREARGDFLSLDKGAVHPSSSLFRLYGAGLREIRKRFEAQGETAGLTGASMDAIKASIDADLVREQHKLNSQMVLLTIAISGGPFLGLLGTVVGVMITFAAIAAAGDVNVNAIAPGIAAALLATVAGLAVAIPALFGYNYLASRIKNITADMQIFVDEFVTRVAEAHGR
ncbi:DUF2341 domain-containing protein [Methyloversatilis thermotolerans]|uniref:DUF2341 domain-containing protein n=1 Tax=Methyloversatilis thermotolerans TaxID=1346290 RepID=UPI00036FF263|nr:DUF2341 domain-containing protein [Methyloversatilis thermotolerans]